MLNIIRKGVSGRKQKPILILLVFLILGLLIGGFAGDSAAVHAATSFTDARPSEDGWLSTKGTWIVNEEGKPVILRGVSTHGLTWYPDYINESLFQDVSQNWNCNAVRLAMYTSEYVKDPKTSWDLLNQGIDAAVASDMYVLADWHILSDNDPNIHINEAKDFFEKLSAKYSDCPNVLYEICNEPNGSTSWEDVKKYAEVIIPVIRRNSPNALIIVGTPDYDQDLEDPLASPLQFDNVLYCFHF